MTRVLLTGGSGFVATHVLSFLLKRGHSVVTTVRSEAKAENIRKAYPQHGRDKLDFAFVKDIAIEGAFDQAVQSNPPFDAVIHTASPFTFAVTDIQKELLDPAVIGTSGILKSIHKFAPTVKRVIITSSFAAMNNGKQGFWPEHTYTEADWNPVTHEEALSNPGIGYSASKAFAEKAAWDFVAKEKPGFTITTLNPPMIYGPVIQDVASLEAVNTSNARIRDAMLGRWKSEIPDTRLFIWIDVRDIALLHVLALENPEVAGQRVFATAGYYSNKEIIELVRKHFPEYENRLPSKDLAGGEFPDGYFKVDNARAKQLLGKEFITFEQTMVDLVGTLKALGA